MIMVQNDVLSCVTLYKYVSIAHGDSDVTSRFVIAYWLLISLITINQKNVLVDPYWEGAMNACV